MPNGIPPGGWIYATAENIRTEYGELFAESVERHCRSPAETADYNYRASAMRFRLARMARKRTTAGVFSARFRDVSQVIAGEVLARLR